MHCSGIEETEVVCIGTRGGAAVNETHTCSVDPSHALVHASEAEGVAQTDRTRVSTWVDHERPMELHALAAPLRVR